MDAGLFGLFRPQQAYSLPAAPRPGEAAAVPPADTAVTASKAVTAVRESQAVKVRRKEDDRDDAQQEREQGERDERQDEQHRQPVAPELEAILLARAMAAAQTDPKPVVSKPHKAGMKAYRRLASERRKARRLQQERIA